MTPQSPDHLRLNLRVRYFWLIAGVALTAIAAIVSFRYGWATTPKDIVPIVSAGLTMTAVVYAALNFHLSTSIRVEELRLKRLDAAISFMEGSATPHIVKAIELATRLRMEMKKPDSPGLLPLVQQTPEYNEALITVFNYFERLGIIVRLEAADETALRDYFSSPVKRYWHTYADWVASKRNEVQTTDLFCEIEALTQRWK